MISAVLHASGPEAAARELERVVQSIGAEPSSRACIGNACLAAWWPATLDAERGLAADVGCGATAEIVGATLRLTRGPVGGRALFWAREKGAILACSRLAPVCQATRAANPNVDELAKNLLADFDLAPGTVFAGIQRVLSGESIVISEKNEHRTRTSAELEELSGEIDDLAEMLRAEFYRAVERGMAGHDRVAVFAGGGLDSSSLLSAAIQIARRNGGPQIDVYALDFAAEGDDRPYMRALSDALGIEPTRVAPRDCASEMRSALVADAAPFVWPTAGWEIALMKMARARGATAALSGVGGDQVLDGDPRLFAASLLQGDLGALLEAARLVVPWKSTPLGRIGEYIVRPIAAELTPRPVRRAWRAMRASRQLPRWAGEAVKDMLERRYSHDAPEGVATATARFEALTLSPGVVEIADTRAKAESAGGITIVEPLFDAAFVATAARVPPRAMLHGGRIRGLLRHAMRGALPEKVRLRPDKAAAEPALAEMLEAAGGLSVLADLASMDILQQLRLVRAETFREDFEAFANGLRDDWLTLWPALATEAFARAYLQL